MPFFDILRLQGDQHCPCAQKGVIFHFFPRAFEQKKIKALRPKMTKIASRGRGPGGVKRQTSARSANARATPGWPARRCPGIRAPRRSLSLHSPSSPQLSRFPINQSRGEHTTLWRKFALRWTCIIPAFAFGKKWLGSLNIIVFITDKRKRARKKKELNVKRNENITLPLRSLPGSTQLYRFAIGRLTDELVSLWRSFFWTFVGFQKKKSHSGMVKRKIRADYRCPRWPGSSK